MIMWWLGGWGNGNLNHGRHGNHGWLLCGLGFVWEICVGEIDKEREGWIDAARGIAIVLVVLGHVIHIVERELALALPGFDVLDRVLYSFHVPVFFFLSGMFLFRSSGERGSGDLLWSRAKRLLYPYLIWSVLQTTLEVVSSGGWRERLAPELFQIIYFPQAHFWFLYVLFFCGAIGIALRSIFVGRLRTVWVLLAVSLVWYGLHRLIPGGPIRDIGVYMPYFALGAWGRTMNDERGTIKCGDWVAAVALMGLFVCSVLLAVASDLETSMLLRLPLGMLGVAAIVVTAYAICSSYRVIWLAYIGRHSMAIYLIHVLAIHAVFMLLRSPAYPVAIGVAMVAGIGLPLLFKAICVRLRIVGMCGLR